MQGYGSYDELTTSGIDTKELFDDIEEQKSSNFTSTDVVVEEYNDAIKETSQECIILGSNRIHASSTNEEDKICWFKALNGYH